MENNTVFNDDDKYASLTGEYKRLYEITLYSPEEQWKEFERKSEQRLIDEEEEAYRHHYEINIKYDSEDEEDHSYRGDPSAETYYGNAVEALVDYYATFGKTEKAIEKAKELLRIREDVIRIEGDYVQSSYWDLRTEAVYKLAWLTKDCELFIRALWLSRHGSLYGKIKKMMERCDLPAAPGEKSLPEWDEFPDLTAENGVDITKDKEQLTIHDEFCLGRGEYTADLSEYKIDLDEKEKQLAREAYFTFDPYFNGYPSYERRRLEHYEQKEQYALYHLRIGERDKAEKGCRNAMLGKYKEYVEYYINNDSGKALLTIALSFYHLGYITGHREPMDKALEYLQYADDPTLNEDIERITAIRDKYFGTKE